jgi:hypothetical protein
VKDPDNFRAITLISCLGKTKMLSIVECPFLKPS